MATQQELLNSFVVKVIKKRPDTRVTIAGEGFIHPNTPEHDGTMFEDRPAEYAIIPNHAVEGIKANNKHYHYSEAYIPADGEKKKLMPLV